MANDNIYIFDAQTGEEIIRPMTDEEQAIRDAEIAAALQAKAEREAEAAEKAARRAEILERLGLTEDEAKLILG